MRTSVTFFHGSIVTMKARTMIAALVLAAACCATIRAADAEPVFAETGPKLDGDLSDACWHAAEARSGFTPFRKEGRTLDDTAFRLAYDNEWLYLAFECKNPLQKLIFKPKVIEHDGPVHTDESVEVFLDPGTDGKLYYHFILSCFNIRAEQRVLKRARDRKWDHPWRSATRARGDGWAAEVAIPLHLLASYGDLGRLRMNVVRNRRAPSMDEHGVITYDDMYLSSWQPVKRTFHETAAFGELAPVRPAALRIPFMAALGRIEVEGLYVTDDGQFFNVKATVTTATSEQGRIEFVVEDRPAAGEGAMLTRTVDLAGHETKDLTAAVPIKSIGDRRVTVTVRNPETGEVWGRRLAENPTSLSVLNAYLDRNYYTSETTATLTAEIGLPPASLKSLSILARGPDGSVLARGGRVTAQTKVAVPIARLKAGEHDIRMELRREGHGDDAPAILSETLRLVKRPPKPGREWKTDQENRVLLHDGEPVFPFGPIMYGCREDDETAMRSLAEAGFNTFFQWHKYLEPEETIKYVRLAKTHGLYAIVLLETGWLPVRAADLKLPEKYLNATEAKELTNMWRPSTIGIRAFLMKAQSGTYAQKTEIFEEYYHKNVERGATVVRSVMNEDNLIGYNTFDEAVANRWFRISDSLAHMRDTVNATDGYHPVFFVCLKDVPEDRVYESATDVWIPDPYWHPASNIRDTNHPNSVSKRIYLSHQRNRKSRKVLGAVPVGWVWSGIMSESKRALSAEEQNCQSFLAIIHGARALFWFRWPMPDIAWENLTQTGRMIKVIGPMAVQPTVAQEIVYEKALAGGERAPDPFDPERDLFPDVQARVFRDPKGGLVLVAANSSYYPVRTEFTVSGLKGGAERLFADVSLNASRGTFTEDLDPLAVRAYRLGDLTEPLKVGIASTRKGKASPLAEAAVPYKWRPKHKNVLPNPSFEEATIPGRPDYYFSLDPGMTLVDDPGAARFGRKCIRMDVNPDLPVGGAGGGRLFGRTAPQPPKPTRFVWSVWLRGEQGGERVRLDVAGLTKTVTLTKEWQRFSLPPFVVQPGLTLRHGIRMETRLITNRQASTGTYWIDGIQLERGEEPTEFED